MYDAPIQFFFIFKNDRICYLSALFQSEFFDERRDLKITTPQFVWALELKGLVPLLAYLSFAPPGVGNGSPTKPL